MAKSVAERLALLAMCGVLMCGAVACGGGAEVQSKVSTATVGQQLLDLKKAYDSGAVTKQEYEQQRKKILEKD